MASTKKLTTGSASLRRGRKIEWLKKCVPVVFFVAVLGAFVFAAPIAAAEKLTRYEASHDAMGTTFSVVAYGRDTGQLAAVTNEVFEEIDRLDGQMSNYNPASELSDINREAARQPVIVEPKLFRLIQDSIRFSEETQGAFDVTVGPLMKAWGFFRGRGRVPSDAELAEVLSYTGFKRLELEPERRALRFGVPGIELDLGGIAKGYAVDRAVEMLRSNGIASALVSSGRSSIYALGAPPGKRGWEVRLCDPLHPGKAGESVLLKNYSLSASGNYEKFFKVEDKIYSHILDPKTGRPVEDMLSTAVLAARAVESDALSTAFYVLGPHRARSYLAAHPNLAVVFYQPTSQGVSFRRVFARSKSFHLPQDALARFKGR